MNFSILAAAASTDTGTRPLAVAPQMKFDKKVIYLNGVRGGSGPGQTITVQNRSGSPFKLVEASFAFSGPDAGLFSITRGRLPRTLQDNAKSTYTITLTPGSDADLTRVLTAQLTIKASGAPGPSGVVDLRAIATTGTGGDNEPSLARIMQLYDFNVDVGDTNPATTNLDLDGGATDETFAPRFRKSGTGPVEITPVATFVSDAPVPGRLGYYTPGYADRLVELYHYDDFSAQSVAPVQNGSTVFDPGQGVFGLYATIPVFKNADGTARRIYSEDALNTWDANDTHKVRVYPLGTNQYVVTFEDYTLANDQNDFVYVISGVEAVGGMAKIDLIAQGGQPVADRLVFSEVGQKNATYPNYTATTGKVRVVNSGNRDLVIDSLALSAGASQYFSIVNPPANAVTLGSGDHYDVTVKFVATEGDAQYGRLTINSNDALEPAKNVQLAGFWQVYSESGTQGGTSAEPTLQEIFDVFGFKTTAVYAGQSLDTNGAATPIGDEIISAYWQRGDTSLPVSVEQIAAYHQQGTQNTFGWYDKNNPGTRVNVFTNNTLDGQTLLPRLSNGSGVAMGSFTPTVDVFGLRTDGESTDDALNTKKPANAGSHHWRFFPLRDSNNNFVPDTYLAVMDFSAINFDFNDNLYIIRNIRPANTTGAVVGAAGISDRGRPVLDWSTIDDATGYKVQRSSTETGKFVTVAENIFGSTFADDSVKNSGKRWYYRIYALADNGTQSTAGVTSVYVPSA